MRQRLEEREAVRPKEFEGYISGLHKLWEDIGKPLRIVELGTYVGNSTFAWLASLSLHGMAGVVHTVDIDITNSKPLTDDIQRFGWEPYVALHIADSVDFAEEELDTDTVELVYIDTSHEYLQTRREIEAWLPHLRKEGWLVLDDPIGYPDVLKAFCYCLEVSCRGKFDHFRVFTRPPYTPESHGLLVAKLR